MEECLETKHWPYAFVSEPDSLPDMMREWMHWFYIRFSHRVQFRQISDKIRTRIQTKIQTKVQTKFRPNPDQIQTKVQTKFRQHSDDQNATTMGFSDKIQTKFQTRYADKIQTTILTVRQIQTTICWQFRRSRQHFRQQLRQLLSNTPTIEWKRRTTSVSLSLSLSVSCSSLFVSCGRTMKTCLDGGNSALVIGF